MLSCAVSRAYLNAPAENLTLPELLKEFKSIQIVKAARVDLEQGVVVWSRVEQIQGKTPAGSSRHLLKIKGKVPPALGTLAADQTAVFFSDDGWDRGLVLTAGCWYVVGYEARGDCWRIAYTDLHYDFNTCFSGTPAQLEKAIGLLLAGDDAMVECRVKPGEKQLQAVRYTMKRPKEKKVVGAATREAE